jgi:hypothetical protein
MREDGGRGQGEGGGTGDGEGEVERVGRGGAILPATCVCVRACARARVHHKLVGDGVEEGAERRLDLPPAREVAADADLV